MFSPKPDYSTMFSSPEETHRHIYRDPSRTADILFSDAFIAALANSPHQQKVDKIVRQEALKGNIPSALYMISLLGILQSELPQHVTDKNELLSQMKALLRERIKFCDIAISGGRGEQAYYAMASSVQLFNLIKGSVKTPGSESISAVNDIVKYGDTFVNSAHSEHDLIDEVKQILDYWRPQAELITLIFNQ